MVAAFIGDAVALAESLGIGQRTISFSQKSRIQIAHTNHSQSTPKYHFGGLRFPAATFPRRSVRVDLAPGCSFSVYINRIEVVMTGGFACRNAETGMPSRTGQCRPNVLVWKVGGVTLML